MTTIKRDATGLLGGALIGNGYAARRRKVGIWFVLPAIIVLVVVIVYPLVQSMLFSFQAVQGGGSIFGGAWVGLKNYTALFSDPTMLTGLLNTLYYTAVEVIAVVVLSLLIGLLLSHRRVHSAFFRIVLLIPWAIAPVANATFWKWIYNANYGILNAVLQLTGITHHSIVWLGTPFLAINMLLLADIWKSIPFITLLMLAGIQNIPPVLYRAAQVDGASVLQRFWYVTLPQLKPTILITIVLQSMWAMKVFDLIYVLTKGGPVNGTVTLNFWSYLNAFSFGNVGYGAAIANVLFLLLFVIALAYVQVLGRTRKTNAGK